MSTVDQIEVAIRGRLLRGELAPGERIRQDELAAELGVSKIPVREALQRLAGLGLLRFEANRGASVPRLTVQDAEENFSLRAAIEPILLAESLPKLTIVDLAEAELSLRDGGRSPESNWHFHHALYRASGWQRGLAMVEILHASVAPYVLFYIEDLGGESVSDVEHHELLQACRDGDLDAAVTRLTAHVRAASIALTDFLAARGSVTMTAASPTEIS